MGHQIEDVEVEEQEYDENADEDFNPEAAAAADEEASSSSEDEERTTTTMKPAKKSAKRKSETVKDLDSGDEATIQERKRKRRKGGAAEDGESGGEGGLIKTRAQRLAEKVEKKQRRGVVEGEATIDVEKTWAELSSVPVGRRNYVPAKLAMEDMDVDGKQVEDNAPIPCEARADDEMITIKRRVEYAGEITEVKEQHLRTSKEAKDYLASHPEADSTTITTTTPTTQLLRPLARPSIFEPNPTSTVKGVAPEKLRPRAPSRLDVLMAEKRAEEERKKKAEKMTTVQKSALDWRGFVDQQGWREELDEYGKSKGGFLGREAFLDRAQAARDGAAREARLRG